MEEAGHNSTHATSLTDLPPSLLRLILARIPSLADVRSLLRTCTAMMEYFDDVEAHAVWLARNRPEQAVRLAVRAKCPDVALHLLDMGLKADKGDPGGAPSVLQEICSTREALCSWMHPMYADREDKVVIETVEAAWAELVTRLCQRPKWVRRGGQWRLEDHSSTDPGTRTDHGDTLLHLAAARGKWGVVDALVRERPDLIMVSNHSQQLPTEVARGSPTMAALLGGLKQQADTFDEGPGTSWYIPPRELEAEYEKLQKQVLWAFVWACQGEDDALYVLEELAEATPRGRMILQLCNLSINGLTPGTMRAHLNEDVGFKFVEGDTPLHLAVKSGNETVIEFLLRTWLDRIDFNARNSKGETVHHVAPNARVVLMLREAEEKQESGGQFGDEDEEDEDEEDWL